MAMITEAVGNFLKRAPHNNPDLVAWWTPQLETQVFVSPEGGFPVEERRNAWTDGKGDTWSHIRFPMNANAEPYWRDRELTFLLEDHCLFIGSTGWNYVNRESWFVGFDFDDITSHAPGVGVDDYALAEVKEKAMSLPYVDVIKSTGGKGLHLYIRFDRENAPKTANHTEHAAVARALLGKMSTDVAFDFGSHLDVCGHVMWLWGKKSTSCKHCGAEEEAVQHVNSKLPEYHRYENTGGHTWVKKATVPLTADDLPPNWRDNIEVISKGGQGKVRVTGYSDDGKKVDEQDSLAELSSSRVKYDLNDVHKAILNDLEQTGASVVWVADHHLVQTHTCAFKMVFDKWKEAGHRMKGFFETSSLGTDMSKPNCFAIPGPKGSWFIYRFGKGSAEHKLWSQDDVGWTWAKYNSQPNLHQAALALGGKEDEKGGYVFDTAEAAQETVANIGSKLMLPPENKYGGRETVLRRHRDGRLVVELKKWEGDEGFDDWIEKKDKWVRIYNINTNSVEEEKDYSEFDALTRSVRTPSNTDAGWMIRAQSEWVRSPATNVVRVLKAVAPSCDENKIMGTAILNQWTLVNMPFHEEHPGGRNWNYGAAQFRYQPTDTEDPKHPHWDRILSHIGEDLDRVVKNTGWCQKWGLQNGRDYLTAWIACMFREPFEPLPYLFIYGDQGCGKSILHEVISLLVTGGVVKADTALTNQSDFNGELANGVLAVIDEKNVAQAGPSVYNKIKEWTTSLTLSVHRKGMEPYQQRNSLHFIQLANERDACPVFPGDTRIVVIRMGPLVEEIAKPLLIKRCVEEAPDFMATLMNFQLPESMTRLRLPVLETDAKRSLMDMNTSPLEGFLREHCSERQGRHIVVKDFYEKFQATLSAYERSVWTKSKIRQNLPDRYPIGNYTANKLCIGNLSFDSSPVPEDGPMFVTRGGRLKLSTDEEE
jgi:hypothetical protein